MVARQADIAEPVLTITGQEGAARHDFRATLRGPGISPATAACRWIPSGKYLQCSIATPRHIQTGHSHRYSISATEKLGSGFIEAPITAASENPEPVHFR